MTDTPTPRQRAAGCKHFNGVQHDECKAGISYGQFRGIPCIAHNGIFEGTCPLFEFHTEAELDAEEAEAQAAATKFFENFFSDTCPWCGQPIRSQRQSGRCVYADPCGHRLYQGKVGAFKRKDQK